jgi:hypothetical protein
MGRLELQSHLETILGSDKVYFSPPASLKIVYPCIIYHRDLTDTRFADNNPYSRVKRYQVTVIDRNPDSLIPEKVGALPMCLHNRFFTADNLNHDVFNLYY